MRFGIGQVILVHGTFMGDDPFAISETLDAVGSKVSVLEKPLKSLAAKLKDRIKPITDDINGDVGNYDTQYQDHFQQLVGEDPVVHLLKPTWSGQNHHFARADLAVRLLCLLDDLSMSAPDSVLLWGHSHAGNGFAILTNLLANDHKSVAAFFEAAAQKSPHWQRAQSLLMTAPTPHPLAACVRIAAFGTPVRYGWDTTGCRDLIHVLHHRPHDAEKSITTKPLFLPHRFSEMVAAEFGDWVQAFGISGTDVVPPTSSAVNQRLEQILESGLEIPELGLDTKFLPAGRIQNLCARWKTGTRCHTNGQNLLVKYEPCGRTTSLGLPIEQALFGHGVATTTDWLPTHLALVMRHLSDDVA